MIKLLTIGICILKLILIEANEYCDLEPLYCEGRSHVSCNKITNSDTDEIIELTPYLHQRLLQNLNKFRNDVALGLCKDVTHIEVSNMNILKWNSQLKLLSENASLKLKHTNGVQNLCYATSEYPEPVLIFTSLNDGNEVKDINIAFIDRLTTSLIDKYQINSVLSNPSSHDIGCAVTKVDKLNLYSVACIVYGIEDIDNFKYGKPCSNCDLNECDSIYQGLCTGRKHDVISSWAQQGTNGSNSNTNFQLDPIHIIAVYVLLGGLVLLIILMLILIKYLCQYTSHISL